jgi:hypothetical protein
VTFVLYCQERDFSAVLVWVGATPSRSLPIMVVSEEMILFNVPLIERDQSIQAFPVPNSCREVSGRRDFFTQENKHIFRWNFCVSKSQMATGPQSVVL